MSTLVKTAMEEVRYHPHINLVYDSPSLRVVSIPVSWTMALQLKYFADEDEEDLVHFLRRKNASMKLDERALRNWVIRGLRKDCPQMEYDKFSKKEIETWLKRIEGCVKKATSS